VTCLAPAKPGEADGGVWIVVHRPPFRYPAHRGGRAVSVSATALDKARRRIRPRRLRSPSDRRVGPAGEFGRALRDQGSPGIVGSGSSSCRQPSPLVTTTPRFTSVPPSRRGWLIEFVSPGDRCEAHPAAHGPRGHSTPRWKRQSGGRGCYNSEHRVLLRGSVPAAKPSGSANRRSVSRCVSARSPGNATPMARHVWLGYGNLPKRPPTPRRVEQPTWARPGRGADRLNQPTVSRETNGEALTWGSGRARIGVVIRRTGETG
jgi:hypothetical protein